MHSAEDNARHFNYNDREAALAETLEIAQVRIMELVSEMESNQEAQTIVLETKESVLRSLARQNTHLAMEVRKDTCSYVFACIFEAMLDWCTVYCVCLSARYS